MSPLCHLLVRSRDPSSEVARRWDSDPRAEESVCWEAFQRDVAGLSERVASQPPGGWVLLTEDAYAFAVGLFGLWHAGRHAISPPNRQPSALRALQTRAVGSLSDRPAWFPDGSSVHPLDDVEPRAPDALGPLHRDALALELFTSGTTGGEKPVLKQIRHLEDEVRELHAGWSALAEGAAFFSAASHQHLYGLLFGVLWPLHAGRPFGRHHLLHPGELVPRMEVAGDCLLASVPTQLKRLARHVRTPSLRGKCHAVFSSGGPLAAETAFEIASALGAAPIEVLGSTETGGIAWRRQLPDEQSEWTPFPRVCVSSDEGDELLRVRSPFVSVDAAEGGIATGDRVSLRSDGRFELKGRADRVVKIGEKRLDLTRMEAELRRQPAIDDAALTTLDREGIVRLAAAVVPSDEGLAWIRQEGQREFVSALGAGLADAWDPVFHPRYWRVVTALPTNAQGKLTLQALRGLFRADPASRSRSDRPEVLEEVRGADFLERSCRVPRKLRCFEGHFPGHPIVPGVLQLDWAMELAAELMECSPRVDRIESLKFLAPLLPGDAFRIGVRVIGGAQVEVRIWGDHAQYARGRVRLHDPSGTKP